MLQQMNSIYPYDYKKPLYVVWGLSFIMLVCIIFIPESPWFLARHDRKEDCIKVLKRLYGTVEGYDADEEYGIIQRTLAHERFMLSQQSSASWKDLFTGRNLERTVIVTFFEIGCLLIGLSMFATFGTCELSAADQLVNGRIDFFAIAGLSDPFLANLITRCDTSLYVLPEHFRLRLHKFLSQHHLSCLHTRVLSSCGQGWASMASHHRLSRHVPLLLAHRRALLRGLRCGPRRLGECSQRS